MLRRPALVSPSALVCTPIGRDGAVALLDFADGDRGGVTPCLVGRRGQFCKRRVDRMSGVESKRVGVGVVEPFDERLGGEHSAAGCAGFDPCGLVYFFAECGDFAATSGEDPSDV